MRQATQSDAATKTATPKGDKSRLRVLVHSALKAAGGDWHAAHARILRRLQRDARLREELLAPLLSKAVWDLVRYVGGSAARREILLGESEESVASMARVGMRCARNLLDFPLQGGVPLRDATRAKVLEAATFYGKIARTNAIHAEWLSRIAAALPDDVTTVGAVLTDAKAQEVLEEVSTDR